MESTKAYTTDPANRLAVTTEGLQELLSCGRKCAIEIGEAASAELSFGRRRLWNVDRVRRFLDEVAE